MNDRLKAIIDSVKTALKEAMQRHGRSAQRERWKCRNTLRMFGAERAPLHRTDRAFGGRLNKRLVHDPRPALRPHEMRATFSGVKA
jgi:hypothetical protein